MNSIKKTREFLQSVGLPRGDAYDLMADSTALKSLEFKGQRLCRLFWKQWMGMVCICIV